MATRTPVTPLYAIAGAGDLAVEKVRAVGADVTTRFAKLDQKAVQAELTKRQSELTAELTKRQAELTKRFEALVADARTAPAKLRELPAVAQAGFTTVLGQAEETYEDLAGRGKDLVGRIRSQKATADFEARREDHGEQGQGHPHHGEEDRHDRAAQRQGDHHRGQEDREDGRQGHHRRGRQGWRLRVVIHPAQGENSARAARTWSSQGWAARSFG